MCMKYVIICLIDIDELIDYIYRFYYFFIVEIFFFLYIIKKILGLFFIKKVEGKFENNEFIKFNFG